MAETKPDKTVKPASLPDELVKDLDVKDLDVKLSAAERNEVIGGKMTIKLAPETSPIKPKTDAWSGDAVV